nr:MAG TPA: hypothetical protein [Caudoviricetes sp.]
MANVEYKGKVPVFVTLNEKETRKIYDAKVGWVTVYYAEPAKWMDDKTAEKFVRDQLEKAVKEAMKTYKR